MSIEAMKQALAKFEHLWEIGIDAEYKVELLPEIEALRQAIEQAEYDKLTVKFGERAKEYLVEAKKPWDTSDMAHRPNGLTIDDDDIQEYKKPWVGLTEDESDDIYNAHNNTYGECITSAYDLVLDIEAKLKEKNT
jgi:hypothetical protein